MLKQRDYSMDILKFLAGLGVVLIHVDANFRNTDFWPNTQAWDLSLAINLLTKWCIPVFIMISGYYVLNSKKEVTYREFLKKRFSKVLIPFFVWSLIYNLYYQYISSGISMKWTIFGLVKNVMGYPTAAPLWFLYPLMGLYLMTPIFKKIVAEVDGKMILILIGFAFIIRTVAPFTDMMMGGQMNYWKDIPLSNSAFGLYFIIGGYLGKTDINKNLKYLIYMITIVTFSICFVVTYKTPVLYDRSIEVFLDISAINNMLVCISLFLAYKDMKFAKLSNNKIFVNTVDFLSTVNFGVFLLHPIVIDIVKLKFFGLTGDLLTLILVQVIIVYFITSVIVYVMKKSPILKRIV